MSAETGSVGIETASFSTGGSLGGGISTDMSPPASVMSISSPEASTITPMSEYSQFHAFDPSVFEKPPSEFGHTDPFKDTAIIASAPNSEVQGSAAFNFSDYQAFSPIYSEVQEGPVSFKETQEMISIWEAPKESAETSGPSAESATDKDGVVSQASESNQSIFEAEVLTSAQPENESDEFTTTQTAEDEFSVFEAQTEDLSEITDKVVNSTQFDQTDERLSEVREQIAQIIESESTFGSIFSSKEPEAIRLAAELTIQTSTETQTETETAPSPELELQSNTEISTGTITITETSEEYQTQASSQEALQAEAATSAASSTDIETELDAEEKTLDELDGEPEPPDKKPTFVVDVEANSARKVEALSVLATTSTDKSGKISGLQIASNMNQVPSKAQISEIRKDDPVPEDGSHKGFIEKLATKNFDGRGEAVTGITEILEDIPAVKKANAGTAVEDRDVERVKEKGRPKISTEN